VELLAVRAALAVLMVAAGGLIVWIARVTASGRLRSNHWAGIRTQATLSSDQSWLDAHRAGRPLTEAGGWCAIATGVLIAAVPFGSDVAVAVSAGVGVTLMLALVIGGAWRGTAPRPSSKHPAARPPTCLVHHQAGGTAGSRSPPSPPR
jgi:hypothetical protein